MKVALKKEDIPALRAARWRARTDLLFLANHILGNTWINQETHGPVIERLQKFQKPNEVEYEANDYYDPKQKTWIYRPVIRHQDLEGSRFMLLLDPRGHAKCLVSGSKQITYPDGTKKDPSEVKVGDYILGTESEYSYRQKFVRVTGVEVQPPQECVDLKLRSGRILKVSANHPIRTIEGFVNAGDLTPGDRVATLAWIPEPENAPYEADSELTGWFLGDGSFSGYRITNNDSYFRQRIIAAAARAGFTGTEKMRPSRAWDVTIRGARQHYQDMGLHDTRSGTKYIPEKYFKADNKSVAELLYGLYMSDGYCGKDGIDYVTKSPTLAENIQVLLLRFGIKSKRVPYNVNYRGEARPYWHVIISDSNNVRRFIDIVGWDKINRYKESISRRSNVDTVPKEWKNRFGKYLFARGEKPDAVPYASLAKYDISKQKLAIYAEHLRDEELKYLAGNNIYWDTVDTVVRTGLQTTIGIETESKTLCVHEVITHNTTLNVIAHIIQFIINYPNITCLVIVANEDRAATIVSEIAEHFKTNELFRRLFPEHCPDPEKIKSWGNMSGFTTLARDFSYEDAKVKRESTVYVGSIDAGVASRHFDVIKCSDIVDDKNSENGDQCQKIANRFSLLQPVVVNERSWMYVEGTRYHANDVYGQIIENEDRLKATGEPPKYTVFFRSCYRRVNPTYTFDDVNKPWELDAEGKRIPIFPFNPKVGGGFSLRRLEQMQQDPIDGLNFNCQYLNDPTPTEASPLPVDESHPALIDPDIFYSKIKIGYRDMAVDFAYTQTSRSDFTAISVMAWDYANRPYVEDIAHDKFTIEESVATLLRMYKKYKPSSVYIEDTPFTRGLEPTLEKAFQAERLYPNWVWVKRPGNQKKTSRVEASLTMWWKTRALKFVHSEARPLKAMAALKKEASTFPKGKHDDILDTLADLFTDKDYFGRLGPRDIEDPAVQKSAWEAWRDSEHGTEEINKMIFGPAVELPNWGSYDNKYGMP